MRTEYRSERRIIMIKIYMQADKDEEKAEVEYESEQDRR